MKKKSKEIPFQSPDIFGTYQKAPASIKKLVFYRIIPASYVNPILITILILFLSPILLLSFDPSATEDKNILVLIILWECFLFLLFSGILGVVFIAFKNPRFQELKDKLGYTD